MKKAFILTSLAVLFLTSSIAQNALFLPFNVNYKKTVAKLENLHDLTIKENNHKKNIVVAYSNSEARYQFHRNKLYQIEVEKFYPKKKTAEKAFRGVIDYFQTIHAKSITFFVEDSVWHFYATKEGVIYELTCYPDTKKDVKVVLTGRYLKATPDKLWTRYDYLAEEEKTLEMDTARINAEFQQVQVVP